MSLCKEEKGVRVTKKYGPLLDQSCRGGDASGAKYLTSSEKPSELLSVTAAGPVSQNEDLRVEDENSMKEKSSQTKASFSGLAVHQQTMEELKSILRDSHLVSIRGREDGKPGSPFTYLHGDSNSSGGGRERREDDDNRHRTFSTFKPRADASRRGGSSRESPPIQLPSTVDSSSSFRSAAKTNRQPGVRIYAHSSGSACGETGDSHSGQ